MLVLNVAVKWLRPSTTIFISICIGLVDCSVIVENSSGYVVATFTDQQITPVPKSGILGRVIQADPETACGPITRPPRKDSNGSFKWIALIRRYNCTMHEKLVNAEEAGYSAVIFYPIDFTDIELNAPIIAVVIITNEAARIFKRNFILDRMSLYLVRITPNGIDDEQNKSIDDFFLALSILIVCCGFTYPLYMFLRQHFPGVFSSIWRRWKMKKLLKILPKTKFKKGDYYDSCSICLEGYSEESELRLLPCHHVFHTQCVDRWLMSNEKCPLCKCVLNKKNVCSFAANERTALIAYHHSSMYNTQNEDQNVQMNSTHTDDSTHHQSENSESPN
ncbi:E3 ubiquitin-protein ligase RNF13-like protein [Dinothrombium tinctorium]|uniref:E3 ubiquitin-protein ligase RNF13-like protein n=1 Tax=Dinothrombium tinctorium TaxID=1965070 RepID=A0A443QBN4_9ACAR|nr:E3 ubiquitin-protein ligase RNF13-like protein [Dinothrombium tinctorium]RWS00518.1 E3 ubiquitin-protein ligase RNF13-like protein [Dinothrombium tinctorium]RWS06537.1 E3 ubiquitin-protein ligase RNF13-like protein [Dinothrombium tinctorium]